ncbi:MAG: LLM class flavin-dependent oxidoreductase [Anaerolineae bacterium]|nr:LLM class flavin-dependent oxidoreductase [Anaerolineae bacterium]
MTHPIQVGYCVPIFAWPGGGLFRTPNFPELNVKTVLETARLADSLGYDSIWVADHLMLGKDQAIMEGWTTLSAIAGMTSKSKLGIIHQGHFFRYPSVAAKMIATLDQISGGRFIYFADTGTRISEHQAYGLNYPENVEERMADFLEGLELTLQLWQSTEENPLTFDGKFHHVKDAVCNPKPVTQPHPPIWFGEAHPITFDAVARWGQGWNSVPVGLTTMKQRLELLKAACQKVSRSFDELEISYEVQILIAPTRAAVRDKLKAILALSPAGAETPQDADFRAFVNGESDEYPRYLTDTGLVGTPDEVKAQLQNYLAIGISHFMLWFMDAPDSDGMKLFIEQVAPAFKSGQH